MTLVISSTSPRTYPVPQAAQEEARAGLRWSDKHGFLSSYAPHRALTAAMAAGEPLTEPAVRLIAAPRTRCESEFAVADGITADRIERALWGGDSARSWARRIVASLDAQERAANEAALRALEYDPDTYGYAGLLDPEDDELLITTLRTPRACDSVPTLEWECFTASGWEPLRARVLSNQILPLNNDVLTLTLCASAVLEGSGGVIIRFGEPVAWLPTTPLLAAVDPESLDDFHVYAVVDGTDTAAVMSLIALSPGPVGYRREGGQWVPSTDVVSQLRSVSPPPIVEITGEMLTDVLEQVDAATGSEGSAFAPEPEPEPEPTTPTQSASSAPVQASAAVMQQQLDDETSEFLERINEMYAAEDARRARFEAGLESLRASGADADLLREPVSVMLADESARRRAAHERIAAAERAWEDRRRALRAAVVASAAADARTMATAFAFADVLYGASTSTEEVETLLAAGGLDRNRGGAEHLRRYWTHGKGALKIRWGTPGDWTRCYRHLRKYLGARAAGYCQLRHKEATGVYTGDKKNP